MADNSDLCDSCARASSRASMRRNVYLIIRRGDNLGNKKFCTLDCVAAYVAQTAIDMNLGTEYFLLMPGHISIHYVELSPKSKREPHAT